MKLLARNRLRNQDKAALIKNNLSIAEGEASLDSRGRWGGIGRVISLEVEASGHVHEHVTGVGPFTHLDGTVVLGRGDPVGNGGNARREARGRP